MKQQNYNPDVLSCLANLSNDEVFTPPAVVNKMLDLLPAELWSNPDAKFLDPVSKTGVFLREIAKRLMAGLEDLIPDVQERADHIFGTQLYGLAITELTGLMSRRSVYCSKFANGQYSVCSVFDDEQGNIRYEATAHDWLGGRCRYCGASQEVYDRGESLESHAYKFIHTDNPKKLFPDMKFDVIIGNPPYQLSDGGSGTGTSALPLYNIFVETAKKLNPRYLSMIIPSRWFAGGRGLDSFRTSMLSDKHISVMVDYPKSRDCFPGVDIAGGVCYFLWEKDYSGECCFTSIVNDITMSEKRRLDEYTIFVRDNIGAKIVKRILLNSNYSHKVLSSTPFGLRSFVRGEDSPFENSITLISSAGISYVSESAVTRNKELIPKYKVYIGKINPDRGGVNNASDKKSNVTTKVNIIAPGEIITETYLLLDYFDSIEEANNCASYFKTRFVRYLINLTMSGMNISKDNFQFVPLQDFSEEWTDEKLYAKYGLSEDEIAFIESMIRPME